MASRMSLQMQISAVVSIFIALLVGSIIVLTGLRLEREIRALVVANNEQIAVARSFELGEMMDKLKW